MKIITLSTITCPECAHQKEEEMPKDSCQFFYACEKCKTVLKPKKGDCCVYCSYGTEDCPPVQEGRGCCWFSGDKIFQIFWKIGLLDG